MKNISDLSSGLLITIIFLAVVVILTTFMAARTVVPYNAGSKYSTMGVEGFTDQNRRPIQYAQYPSGNSIEARDSYLIDSIASEPTAQRIPRISGLFGPGKTNENLDTYSRASGSLSDQCARTSSELSNSKGYLCLDQNQLQLLTTRGGNQTCSSCTKGQCACA
jgi:hypothetical protein